MTDNNAQILQQFREKRPKYSEFAEKLHKLISELLVINKIKPENIEYRTKSESSFLDKIQRPEKNYKNPISEITDISGLRIVLHYIKDVDKVSKIIEKEFTIDKENSIDKSTLLQPNEFGYRSVHYVVSLNKSRLNLPEWSSFVGLKAEFQIRTILQHAWASISRELDYRHEEEVPGEFRRKLFRLSGLLELADEEFHSISQKQKKLQKVVTDSINKGNKEIELNSTSIEQYIASSAIVKEFYDLAIDLGFKKLKEDNERHEISYVYTLIVRQCIINNIDTIGKLEKFLIDIKPKAKLILKNQIDNAPRAWNVSPQFTILLLIIKKYHKQLDTKYLVESGWGDETASRVLKIVSKNQ